MSIRTLLILLLLTVLNACGGGSGDSINAGSPGPNAATVGVVITDNASDQFDEAIATITSVKLLCDQGQQTIFEGSATFDLLQLTDFVELLSIDDSVQPDTCNKIRLHLDSLDLNVLNDDGSIDESQSVNAKLVANGKVDLSPGNPFVIGPRETLFVTLDIDVDRSLKITETGNGQFIVRPVIFARIGETPGFKGGLTRVSGIIDDTLLDVSGIRLCMTELTAQPVSTDAQDEVPTRCLWVTLDEQTGVFGPDGLPVPPTELQPEQAVTVVGLLSLVETGELPEPIPVAFSTEKWWKYSDSDSDHSSDEVEEAETGSDPADETDSDSGEDPDTDPGDGGPSDPPTDRLFILESIVIEIGAPGTFAQLAGRLASGVDPATDRYELRVEPASPMAFEMLVNGQLYPDSRIIDPEGTDIDPSLLEAGDRALVDGVRAAGTGEGEADVLRTALMIVRADTPPDGDEEILIGKVLDIDGTTLMVATETGDRCVDAADAAVLFIAESGDSLEVIRGTLDDLPDDATIIAYGTEGDGGCFMADVIVTRGPPKPEPL